MSGSYSEKGATTETRPMFGVLNRLRKSVTGWRLGHKRDLLALALNNMTQGVVMFDTAGRLAVCNEQYLAMYKLSPEVVKPGAALIDIIRERNRTGSLQRDPAQYCAELMANLASGKIIRFVTEAPDGRAISVVNRAIPGSRYWVGTHDDITERRLAERKSAQLGEQEARRAVVEEAIAWFREGVEGVPPIRNRRTMTSAGWRTRRKRSTMWSSLSKA